MRCAAGALWVAATVLLAAPAGATEVSRAQLAALAERAATGDPGAVAALEDVSSVDGRAFDPEAVLGGADGSELERRIGELRRVALEPEPSGPDAGEARADATQILGADVPPPAEESDGDGEASFGLDGVPLPVALAVAAVIVALGALAASGAARRRLPAERRDPGTDSSPGDPNDGPGQLERQAADAEQRGDFATAIRLRFHAGLLRLDALGAVRLRPSLTAEMAVRESGASELDPLAGSYQRVVFGGKGADRDDAERQRTGWIAVIREVRSR